ncbi:putative RNA methyltransferase [Catenovulum sediminis]|uniref:RNA methyltransferase n=1 Tax=Catenovulum sediminis TaxID=1740262 RepID=A0ABV1RDG8_9ALTE|nr:methyltransferase domain-containing protein [Catenovulum sediminis]
MAQLLTCPFDQKPLTQHNNSLQCDAGHTFDIAKQGYVNLLPVQNKRSKQPGDDKLMVNARREFLQSGAYQFISQALNEQILKMISDMPSDQQAINILDAGCGEGYYLRQLQKCLHQHNIKANFYASDISKDAILSAAKQDKHACYFVASNKALPIQNERLSHILCLFGFPTFACFADKLAPDGYIFLLESAEKHLIELRELIYPQIAPFKLNHYPQAQAAGLQWVAETTHTQQVMLNAQQIAQLMYMTPHGHRASVEKKSLIEKLDSLDITIDIRIRILQKCGNKE